MRLNSRPDFWVVLGPKRAVVDPDTGLLWRFPSRDEAAVYTGPDLTLHNGWLQPDGTISISTFGGNQ